MNNSSETLLKVENLSSHPAEHPQSDHGFSNPGGRQCHHHRICLVIPGAWFPSRFSNLGTLALWWCNFHPDHSFTGDMAWSLYCPNGLECKLYRRWSQRCPGSKTQRSIMSWTWKQVDSIELFWIQLTFWSFVFRKWNGFRRLWSQVPDFKGRPTGWDLEIFKFSGSCFIRFWMNSFRCTFFCSRIWSSLLSFALRMESSTIRNGI